MMFGNLTVEEIQRRCGVEFPENVVELMKETWQQNADVGDGKYKWHGFDIPFCIYCGCIELAQKLFEELGKLDWSGKNPPTIQYAKFHRLQEVEE